MRRALFSGVAVAALLTLAVAGPAQASTQHRFPHRTAEVSVLHAVPNTPVDVFAVPAGIDVSRFRLVDVSDEPRDGNPAHSGNSIVRGVLRS